MCALLFFEEETRIGPSFLGKAVNRVSSSLLKERSSSLPFFLEARILRVLRS